eukprot:g2416.t1
MTNPDCLHYVCYEGDSDSDKSLNPAIFGTKEDPIYNGPPAKTYSFALDQFQKLAIACVERKESVLVSAHTSAGKTVVAEYACAVAFREHQKVVYTSPIKALSNQKFRELEAAFADQGETAVGLMTGDVTLNPHANVIVMTTEILRSMLYRGSEMLREIAWVIFDEVHYMQDKDRGVVWEETIIILPHEIRMVFLSATLPNAKEFAKWIAHIHQQPCHVVYTEARPVPLKFFGFTQGGQKMAALLDSRGNFHENYFTKLMNSAKESNDKATKARKVEMNEPGKWKKVDTTPTNNVQGDIRNLVQLFQTKDYLPVIIFAFGKRAAELSATSIAEVMDLTNSKEKEQIDFLFKRAISSLCQEDQELEAIRKIRPVLRLGIAVHHSGMLPILKELTEILFQQSLIKVLCATETFAMGLNMPARTVLFTGLHKFDGTGRRPLTSGEFIQMSGRAGRRGSDKKGFVVLMLDSHTNRAELEALLKGKATPLDSSFKLSYYTVLNLLQKVEGTQQSIHDIIRNSFQQFQHDSNLPRLKQEMEDLQDKAASLKVDDVLIKQNRRLELVKEQISKHTRWLTEKKITHQKSLLFWSPGRLIKVRGWGPGVVIAPLAPAFGDPYFLDVALAYQSSVSEEFKPVNLLNNSSGVSIGIFPLPLNRVEDISRITIPVASDLRPVKELNMLLLKLIAVVNEFKGDLPLVRWIHELETDDPEVLETMSKVEKLEIELVGLLPMTAGTDGFVQEKVNEKIKTLVEIDKLRKEMENSILVSFEDEYKSRVQVLKKLGHINENGVLTLKGKAACYIDAGDELVSAELLFNGVLKRLNKNDLVAFLSCLVPFHEKTEERSGEHPTLHEAMAQLKEITTLIAHTTIESRMEMDEAEYVESFHPWFLEIMYAWSKGSTFHEVCQMTEIFEGVIIRAARRLAELIEQLGDAARVIGDMDLVSNLQEANITLKRDIMFSASLYFD